MFNELKEINTRPAPFQYYTAKELWTNEHTSKKMLEYHLNQSIEAASRNMNFINKSVEWMVDHFNINNNAKIADFGCGPGFYTTMLAEKGANVTGIDFSENSLEYARRVASQKNLKINYILDNYLDFETTDYFDLIIMIMCDFCALNPEQRKKMLSKFKSLLNPNGSIVLDVHSMKYFDLKKETAIYELNQLDGFWSPDDYYCFINTYKYEKEKVILDKYTIIEEARVRTVYNWSQCYSLDSLRIEFEENGLKIEEVYSNVAAKTFSEESTEIAIVAKTCN